KDPANAKPVRQFLISELKHKKSEELLPYYKLIAQTEISDLELLGLLNEVKKLCTKESDKQWYQKTLAKVTDKLKSALQKAILGCSLKDVIPLLDLIHPITLPAVDDALKQVKMSELPQGPNLSVCLVVRAMRLVEDPAKPEVLKAMNDLAEA